MIVACSFEETKTGKERHGESTLETAKPVQNLSAETLRDLGISDFGYLGGADVAFIRCYLQL